jgi:hypothetical protein
MIMRERERKEKREKRRERTCNLERGIEYWK